MVVPPTEILLYRHAEAAWLGAVRPWLEVPPVVGQRSWVVVATRGQAQAWKQLCVEAGVPLMGVEFLTPGLARQKWLSCCRGLQPALGREFLLWGLREEVERRLTTAELHDADRALLLSLQSDLETALDDYDSLLRSGRTAEAFPWPPLRDVFSSLEQWVRGRGFDFSPRQAVEAANSGSVGELPARVLVVGLGAESVNEFFAILALVRRCRQATLVLPEPEFRGRGRLDEQWIERWEAALGAVAVPVDCPEPEMHCGGAVEGWLPDGETGDPLDWARVDFRVGHTAGDEAAQAVDQVRQWLAAGATSVTILCARADLLYLAVRKQLQASGVAYQDQVGAPGFPAQETQVQRALLAYWAEGGRWQELLELWPRLWAMGATVVPSVDLRRAAQRWFDATQDSRVAAAEALFAPSEKPVAVELRRLLPKLTLALTDPCPLSDLLGQCERAFEAWDVGLPEAWPKLRGFALLEASVRPARSWFSLILSFLDQPAPEGENGCASGFCRVVVATRRRSEGVPRSHTLLVGANAGRWPERRESSCWLPDETRAALSAQEGAVPLPTADERAWLERCAYARLARDTSTQLCLTASMGTPEDPEERLAPNSWLERLLSKRAAAAGGESAGSEALFLRAAGARLAAPFPPAAPGGRDGRETGADHLAAWAAVWRGRRDPTRGFDAHFLGAPTHLELGPAAAAARTLEAGLKDPAVLWFETVLKAPAAGWAPWLRARAKWIGQNAHEVLAHALSGPVVEGCFGETPARAASAARGAAEVARRRGLYPGDQYWDSCFAELGGLVQRLLEVLYAEEPPPFCATEVTLPDGAWVPLGGDGRRFGLRGRLDLVLSDLPDWAGATVTVVDFKTGRDAPLTAQRMARGESLQLGLYLAALRSLGIVRGRVRMVRPVPDDGEALATEGLDEALAPLGRLRRHLDTGLYGALTPEPNEYSKAGYTWPLACTPVPEVVLRAKQAATFPEEES